MDTHAASLALRRLIRETGAEWTGSHFAIAARDKPCHGYQNGCICGCSPLKRHKAPKQPWDLAA